jgi:hypothetical protein
MPICNFGFIYYLVYIIATCNHITRKLIVCTLSIAHNGILLPERMASIEWTRNAMHAVFLINKLKLSPTQQIADEYK